MTLRAFFVFALTLAFLVTPFLVPFDGFNPDLYPVPQVTPPVLPAGYAFSLWGVIYLWLAAMASIGLWRHREDAAWDATRTGYIISMSAGVPWLSVAEVSPFWATLMIWVMLGGAIWALVKAPHTSEWTLGGPLGLYAGWLTAASCVALGLTGAGWGVGGLSDVTWALIALCLALCIALAVLWRRPGLTYGLAVIWALIAVMVRNEFAGSVTLLAGAGAVVVLVWTVLQWRKRKSQAV